MGVGCLQSMGAVKVFKSSTTRFFLLLSTSSPAFSSTSALFANSAFFSRLSRAYCLDRAEIFSPNSLLFCHGSDVFSTSAKNTTFCSPSTK